MEQTDKKRVLHVRLGCGSLSITTPVSIRSCSKRIALASELGSCQILCNSRGHERFKKSKDSDCFYNVNILR